jgi:ribosome maturation factor RimP
MKQAAKIDGIIQPVIESMSYEYVGCEQLPQKAHSLLRIYIDKPGGVTIDDCTAVSRQLSGLLDVEEPMKEAYTLEVSSPGIERPLFALAQFKQFVGKQVAVKLYAPLQKRRKLSGVLLQVNDAEIVIEEEDRQYTVPFSAIAKANLVADFNI